MKKFFTLLLLIPCITGFGQIISNGGFEATPYDNGWETKNSATIEAETNASNVHSGSTSLKLTAGAANSLIKLSSAVTPGVNAYLTSFWVKGTAGTNVKLQNVVKNGSNNYLNISYTLKQTDAWEKVEAPFAIDDASSSIFIQIQCNTKDAVYYIDDIEIVNTASNTVLNGDMESGAQSNWYNLELKNSAIGSKADESSDVAEGSNAMKIEVTGVAATPSIGDVQVKNTGIVPFNGSAKVVSFYAKATPANQGETPKIMIAQAYMDAIGKSQAGGVYSGTMQLNSNYRQYKYAIDNKFLDKSTPPVEVTSYYFTNTIRCGEVEGTYYIDNITIEEYPGTPSITSTAVTEAQVNTAYSYTAVSSNPGLGRWTLSKPETGAEWLSIDPYTGELSGTPAAAGSLPIEVAINDGINTIVQAFTIEVSASTSIDDISENSDVNLYPNPATNKLFISNTEDIQFVEIYSISGQRVLKTVEVSNGIDISSLNNGMYIVSTTINGQSIQRKFTKR